MPHNETDGSAIADREESSIFVYKDEKEVLNRAKRRVEYEVDDDLALHEALVMLAETYLEMAGENENDQLDKHGVYDGATYVCNACAAAFEVVGETQIAKHCPICGDDPGAPEPIR